MNILLTCSGRRNYLVDFFREAVGGNGKIYTMNSTVDAASMVVSDGAIVAPPVYEKGYIDFLMAECEKREIRLVVPLFDLELPVLAKNRQRFEDAGICIAISDKRVISVCADKLESNRFLKRQNLETLYSTGSLSEALRKMEDTSIQLPFYVKPRWGMGSLAVQTASTRDELQILYKKVKQTVLDSTVRYHDPFDPGACVIIQEKGIGAEFGLDVVNDFEGNYHATFVKRKIEMRFGETQVAVVEQVPELVELGRILGTSLKHRGILDVDLFWDGSRAVVLEMNARFGGGYPFSHLAGANVPAAYIKWAKTETDIGHYLMIENGVQGFKGFRILKKGG